MNIEKAIIGNTVIFGYNDEDIFENIRNSGRFFEQDILDRWLPYYRNAKTIMDVGANLGNHTLYFCKNTKANSIYAFEPYVDNYRLLNRNAKFNDCGNVICNQFAVGGTTGKAVPVRLPDKRYLGNVQYRYADDSDADTQHSVQIISLDDFVKKNNIQSLDFLKIDAEGFGPEILSGMKGILKKDKPVIWIETEESDCKEIYTTLERSGYFLKDVYRMNALFLHPETNKEVEKASEAELFNQLINMTGEMLRWKEKCQMTEDKLKRIRIVENESHS